ncbi:methylisocitrate lyase [Fontivita pretiosa]|uniref:methylisocitrate lyase n=1 Tax=Fontivita pretiosa TaxID=2989684 RepID=UPI003D164CA1
MSTARRTGIRRLIARRCVAMPGAFNAYVARLIERAGFEACYISGAGLANATAGVPDIGLLSLEEVVRLAGYICDAVSIPVIADADTGFGAQPHIARTVRHFERIGLAGMHIEDQQFPKRCGHLPGKTLVPVEEMCARIRAAVDARHNPDFLIIARCDARSVQGLQATIDRCAAYLQAGADAIFPEALQSAAEFGTFAKAIGGPRVPLLANMTEFGRSPLLSVTQLAKMGYRMVIFPQTAFRASMWAAEQCLRDLHRLGTQQPWLDQMQTRQELYQVLGYDPTATTWPIRRGKV